jgi:hypothetical protein
MLESPMTRLTILHLLLLLSFPLAACDASDMATTPTTPAEGAASAAPSTLDDAMPYAPQDDACWQAARHVEACTGTWHTPPTCDQEERIAAAMTVLARSCESLAHAPAKADGWLCDWFGIGCPTDPVIVSASGSCTSHNQCETGEQCLDGACFDGVGTNAFEVTLDDLTGTATLKGNDVTLLDQNSASQTLRAQMIAGAQHSVHMVNLLFEDNSNTYETIALLKEAVNRGVDVRVIVDSVSQ